MRELKTRSCRVRTGRLPRRGTRKFCCELEGETVLIVPGRAGHEISRDITDWAQSETLRLDNRSCGKAPAAGPGALMPFHTRPSGTREYAMRFTRLHHWKIACLSVIVPDSAWPGGLANAQSRCYYGAVTRGCHKRKCRTAGIRSFQVRTTRFLSH